MLRSRLAARNRAKSETARIQNKGEKRLSRKPPPTAARPVALELLMPRSAKNSPGPSRPPNTAATALRTPRRVTGLPPGYSPYSTRSIVIQSNVELDSGSTRICIWLGIRTQSGYWPCWPSLPYRLRAPHKPNLLVEFTARSSVSRKVR